jgi:phytoene synthase
MATVDDPLERLAAIRRLTAQAMAGQATGEPAFDCLGMVAAECGLTQAMANDVIAGFAADAEDWRPANEQELYQYCYHVAGAVGVMMAAVMGVPADDAPTLDRACDLGLAFQLANIARDIAEDADAGRCYLPMDWLAEMEIPPHDIMQPQYRSQLTALARRLCDASERYEASAKVGAARLPFRARWAVLSAAGIYGDIARKVRAAGSDAWNDRIVISKWAKLARVASAWRHSIANKPKFTSREGLWTRANGLANGTGE